MPEVATYAPGTPIWVDLSSPDLDAARTFYSRIFGWEAQDMGPEAGGYTIFKLRDKMVAGLGPTQDPNQPPAWSTYVSTESADATTRAVREAGGTVVLEPMDVMTVGRMAVYQDPSGAFISAWQPGDHQGAELVNEPNTFCWNELATRDIDGAKRFYEKVFGWGAQTNPMGDTSYTEWKLGDKTIGGGLEMGTNYPPSVPPHWLTYFAVDDADATVATVQELGGRVIVPPTDIPPGRFAVLADPQGAAFAIIKITG